MMGVKMTSNTLENFNMRVGLMLLAGALTGISVTPLIVTTQMIDPSIPFTALAGKFLFVSILFYLVLVII